MTAEEVLLSFQTVIRGAPPTLEMAKILETHKCFFLLNQMPKGSLTETNNCLRLALNSIAVKERYRSCECFFTQTEIKYAVVKGAVLSQIAYGDTFSRCSGDIDILIERENMDYAKDFLLSQGFIQGKVFGHEIRPFTREEKLFYASQTHQMAPFIKATGNSLCPYVNVDVNTDILWGESNRHVDMHYVLANRNTINICGVQVEKLSAEMEFVAICLHHYKDLNSIYLLSLGSLKLILFCDIYFYLRNNDINKNYLVDIAEHLAVGEYIAYCLYYTNMLFQDQMMEEYCAVFGHFINLTKLNTFGLCDAERKEWNISFIERLFHPNLPKHFKSLLTSEDELKIKRNQEYM